MLKEGMECSLEKIVLAEETALKIASGALEVFATPMLAALMENAAFKLVEPHLLEMMTTVGISLDLKHLKANLVGDKLVCKASLVKIEGQKLTFDIKVTHGEFLVGTCNHERFIVNIEKFMNKLKG
ncbi:MAG: thioesterase family protein [Fusobacteriaceae bacterium]